MLRINLLPSYVSQRRLTKRLTGVFVALFLVSLAVPLTAYFSMKAHLDDVSQQADTAETKKKATDALRDQTAATLAAAGPTKAKLQFVDDVHAYDTTWVKLYNTLADQSPKSSFIYTDASVSGPTMTIKAYTPSVEEVGRYLQAMYQESDFSTVTVDHVPGYPDNVRHLYFLNGRMVFADGATASSGTSGSGPSSSGGYSGQGGGPSSSGSNGAPTNYNPDRLAPNGPTNIPADVGPPPPELTGGASSGSSNGPSGQGGSTGQTTGGYSPAFLEVAGKDISPFALPEVRDQILKQALRRVVTKTVPKGFDITVTATLKTPLAAPTLPGAAPAAGPGGRPGFGGPPGGQRQG